MDVELLYNSVKTEVKTVRVEFQLQLEAETDDMWNPDGVLGPEKLLIRCSKESHHPAESWATGSPVEHLENDKDTTLTAIRVGVKVLKFLFGLQDPITRKP